MTLAFDFTPLIPCIVFYGKTHSIVFAVSNDLGIFQEIKHIYLIVLKPVSVWIKNLSAENKCIHFQYVLKKFHSV